MEDIRRIDKPTPPPPPVGGGTASQPGRRRREAWRDYLEREGHGDRPPEAPPPLPPSGTADAPAAPNADEERGRILDERA
jgi:hypothetical protein